MAIIIINMRVDTKKRHKRRGGSYTVIKNRRHRWNVGSLVDWYADELSESVSEDVSH